MILTAFAQVLPASLGVSPDMTTALLVLVKAQVGMMHDLISNEYLVQKRMKHLMLTPGEQIRRHIQSVGGYRC